MTRTELFTAAAVACHVCEQSVLRIEQSYGRDEQGAFVITDMTMVCANGHRIRVEPVE